MNCDDVRALLGAFIDDELSVEIVARINAHVVDCLPCQDERTALSAVRSRVHNYKQYLEPPDGFVDRLKEKVQAQQNAEKGVLKSRLPSYIVPLAAAAAFALFLVPHHSEHNTPSPIASAPHTALLSAPELYSYEDKFKRSKLPPVEFEAAMANKFTGFVPQAPKFHGWALVKTSVASVNSINAIKYSYSQSDHGNIKTMSCYQFRAGVFDPSDLAHHVVDGRSICCGTQDTVSLVYWRNTDKDFVLASELPRADLLSIALDS
jgi:hypothetical protein